MADTIPTIAERTLGHGHALSGPCLLPNGYLLFACVKHGTARRPVVSDPADLTGLTCRCCDAEAEAEGAGEYRTFRDAIRMGRTA